uniref:Endonuclease/exonuclease/phosphatase domain-containing protein n=1 Tax=Latimeria chalumnae TaxID=7897 RepID=H3AI42_LATCH
YNIDVAALREGQLKEQGGGYTFFWKGKQLHGVGFAIKNELINQLNEFPIGINERLMTLRLNLVGNRYATIISVYAPTLDADDEIKEEFYSNLDQVLSGIPEGDRLILLGDFNSRIGRDSNLWNGAIGKEGMGKVNPSGILLLTKCAEHNLTITNSLFHQNKHKTSWQHPQSKHWHLIDYVIVHARDHKDVHITHAMPGTDNCWTDHRLIHSIMSIKHAPK